MMMILQLEEQDATMWIDETQKKFVTTPSFEFHQFTLLTNKYICTCLPLYSTTKVSKMSSNDHNTSKNHHHKHLKKTYRERSDSFDSICKRFDKNQTRYNRENGITIDVPFDPTKHVIEYDKTKPDDTKKNNTKTECKFIQYCSNICI